MPQIDYTPEELAARFWSHVDKNGPIPDPAVYGNIGACWVWTASKVPGGYGQACVGHQRVRPAHHVSAEMAGMDLSRVSRYKGGEVVMHACDNRACVRPSHLQVGTQLQNIASAKARSRSVDPPRRLKLTDAQVTEIRSLPATETNQAIAVRYGVAEVTISHIRIGRTRATI